MGDVKKGVDYVKSNINMEMVISSVVAAFVLGGIVMLANKSGVKVLKQAAAVAK